MISNKKEVKKLNKLFSKDSNIEVSINEFKKLTCVKYTSIATRDALEDIVRKLLNNNFKLLSYHWDNTYIVLEVKYEKKSEIIKAYFKDETYQQVFTDLFSKDVTYLFC